MVSRKKGKILNIGTTGSYIPCPNNIVYTATKSYLLFFTRALYYELKGTNVTVTIACPGATKTEFAKKAGIQSSLMFKLFVMKPKKVAKKSFKAMKKGKREKIIGCYNKLQVFLSKILPQSFVSYLGKRMMSIK